MCIMYTTVVAHIISYTSIIYLSDIQTYICNDNKQAYDIYVYYTCICCTFVTVYNIIHIIHITHIYQYTAVTILHHPTPHALYHTTSYTYTTNTIITHVTTILAKS